MNKPETMPLPRAEPQSLGFAADRLPRIAAALQAGQIPLGEGRPFFVGFTDDYVDFYIRYEFQERGSVHAHCLLWFRDVPDLPSFITTASAAVAPAPAAAVAAAPVAAPAPAVAVAASGTLTAGSDYPAGARGFVSAAPGGAGA